MCQERYVLHLEEDLELEQVKEQVEQEELEEMEVLADFEDLADLEGPVDFEGLVDMEVVELEDLPITERTTYCKKIQKCQTETEQSVESRLDTSFLT